MLSLEEILAEGTTPNCPSSSNSTPHFTKSQIKSLQEAMYHSAENNHLDITVEIRTLGVPWTLHCWMHSLGAAHEARLDCVIDQLLQDFLQVCPDDYSSQFVQECLPLLFNIFRYSKVRNCLFRTFLRVYCRRKERLCFWLISSRLVSVGNRLNRSKIVFLLELPVLELIQNM